MAIVGAFMVPHPPLIVPSVGRGRESEVSLTIDSYHKVAKEIAELRPDTIIISSPHAPLYRDAFYLCGQDMVKGSFVQFGAPDTSFQETIDLELTKKIQELASEEGVPTTNIAEDGSLDHGVMVPLYFIRNYLSDFKVVIVGLTTFSLAEHYHFGMFIQSACNKLNRRVVYVASGDLSHKLKDYGPYGFHEMGPIYDQKIMDTCSNGRFLELMEYDHTLLEKASECGHRSFTMMAGALDGISVRPRSYSHQDVTGVGYGICSFYPITMDSSRHFYEQYLEKNLVPFSKDSYVFLAKRAIDYYVLTGQTLRIPYDIDPILLSSKAGVFVSIHKFGILRGCIGTILPTQGNIAREIIMNAISAATKDPRFSPITEDELDYLEINVDVLTPPEDISSFDELDPKRYGVIVRSGFKRGLLLPDLDGIDDVSTQVEIAMRKGNIQKGEEIHLQRFQVIRHI